LLIDLSTFAPVSRSDDTDSFFSIGEPDREDSFASLIQTNAEEPIFFRAVRKVIRYQTMGIEKRMLRFVERNPVLPFVLEAFGVIPFEIRFSHGPRIA
jgi:hypothetical protein